MIPYQFDTDQSQVSLQINSQINSQISSLQIDLVQTHSMLRFGETWVIFSLPDAAALTRVLRGMFLFSRTDWQGLVLRDAALLAKLPAVPLGLLFSFPLAEKLRWPKDGVFAAVLESGLYLGLFALCIVFLIGASFHPFIYFNF